MTENQAATILAEWLSQEPGSVIPDRIDGDVLETVYALRPEYAPPLRLTIDEVLEVIMEGPLLDPEVGTALDQWLNSPAGTAPPPNLPIGVVEATYALRPDLAPAVRFGIEDILDDVKSGPFATPTVVDIENLRAPNRWWTSPALGAAAVAAIALFFVGPLAHNAETSGTVAPRISLPDEAEAQAPSTQSIDVTFDEPRIQNEKSSELSNVDATKPSPRSKIKQDTTFPPPPTALVQPVPERMAARPGAPQSADPPTVLPDATVTATTENATEGTEHDGARTPQTDHPQEVSTPTADERTSRSKPKRPKPRSSNRLRNNTVPESADKSSTLDSPQPVEARPLRLNASLAILEDQAAQAIDAGNYEPALTAIETALTTPNRTRFDTARLWRTKAKILSLMGRETDAQHARETAAKLDPTR